MDLYRHVSSSVGSVKYEKQLYTHVCTFHDFSLIIHNEGEVESARFPAGDSPFQWFLKLSYHATKETLTLSVGPCGKLKINDLPNKDYYSNERKVFSSSDRVPAYVSCEITFLYLNQNGTVKWMKKCNSGTLTASKGSAWILDQFKLLSTKVDTFSDTVTLQCRFYLMTNLLLSCENKSLQCCVEKDISSPSRYLWTSGNFSDVTLTISDRKFPSHRSVLAANSLVFQKMFESDMQEGNKDVVIDIKDVEDPTLMELMLEFLYLGSSAKVENRAQELIYLADKYDIESLKTTCMNVLFKDLEIENSVDIAILAYQHNLKELRSKTVEFIAGNLDIVIKMPKYKELTAYTDLLNDIIHKNAENIRSCQQ